VTAEAWWRSGVLYQIYPLSFADSNGDGFGDLPGIGEHLDHLAWLGVDGIWLSPITVSPNEDWGYDVADYRAVQPDLGSLADVDRLIDAAGALGIRVLLDLVPNHTSEQHPWFVESRSSRDAARRDWYVWADPKPDGSPPNNWISSFGGPAWKLDPGTGQFYMFNHLPQQPDLNWWNDGVRAEFDGILRFWSDRGVAGFRIDVCNLIVKDAELRDNPPATDEDDPGTRALGQRVVFNGNRPEVHDVIRHWREIADSYEAPRVLIGETPVEKSDELARFYGVDGDELHLAFNFPFITAPLDAEPLRRLVEATEALLPRDAWPVWTGSNHDMSRLATRWAGDDERRIRVALMMLLTLRGTPVLYQGDEIGLGDVAVAREQLRDPLGIKYWPAYAGRDAMRTPMHWRDAPGGGFTGPDVVPWLPLGDTARNVADQRADPGSVLALTRDLIAFRRQHAELRAGSYSTLGAPDGVWAWTRGSRFVVALNLSESDADLAGMTGRISIATDRARDGEAVPDSLRLRAWEGVVVER
jgi:alpha-glucosidase